MSLRLIPTLALVLLNLIVIVYVARERDRARSGFFLLINAISLILWAGGLALWITFKYEPRALALTSLGYLMISSNLVYFAATRPRPLSARWSRKWLLPLAFLPSLVALATVSFSEMSEVRQLTLIYYQHWGDIAKGEGAWPLFLSALHLGVSVLLLAVRYQASPAGPDRNLPLHLISIIAGTTVFAFIFSVTTSSSKFQLIPSPGFLAAVVAQLSILAVIRQEEIERPLYLTRWIYYSTVVLVGFTLATLLYTAYESIAQRPLLQPEVNLTVVAVMVLVVMTASIPRIQSMFDQMMFRRAQEYRQHFLQAQTELFETRDRLRKAERLSVVGETAARIAHEIKNPLGPIKGYTQMMREKVEEMEDFPHRARFLRQLSIIAEEVENIDKKVRQLLDMARKPEAVKREEDINRMVERAATLLRLEVESLQFQSGGQRESIVVLEDLDISLPPIPVEGGRIEEAIANVCRNAVEAIDYGGQIKLATRRARSSDLREGIVITVEDSGRGFSDEARRRIFEPFFTEKKGGTGLGLSIVKSHLDVHGGEVRFEPRPGGGSAISLWLPMEATAETARIDLGIEPRKEKGQREEVVS